MTAIRGYDAGTDGRPKALTQRADRGNADKINKELSSYDADAKAALSSLKSHPKCTGKVGSMVFGIVW